MRLVQQEQPEEKKERKGDGIGLDEVRGKKERKRERKSRESSKERKDDEKRNVKCF